MKRYSFLLTLWDFVEVILVSVISVLLVRYFIFQPFLVNGASMEPSFANNDYLIVDELSYRFREPARGDVVIFRYPKDTTTFFIKRIIGLPNERVVLFGDKITIVGQGQEITLTEPYLQDRQYQYNKLDITLGSDEYFMMGDNRYNSFDSRAWGPLDEDFIIGVARLRLFPFNKIDILR